MILFIEIAGVLLIVFLVVFALVFFIVYNSSWESRIIIQKESMLGIARERLEIANKRYMQGKIKKEIFEDLKLDLEEEIFLFELEIYRLKKLHTLEIEDKLEAIVKKIIHPTKHRRIQIAHLLTETELIRKEMKYLESKFLKREISEKLFKKIIKKKEAELISFENDIIHVVKKANQD